MKGKVKVSNLTHERLLEVLDYDPETGIFVWKISPAKNVKAGAKAGGKPSRSDYAYIRVDGEEHTTSRLAWFYANGSWPERRVRFKNGLKNDARLENLTLFNGIGGEYDFKSREGRLAYARSYRANSPQVEKARSLRESFGLTLAEYGKMLVAQNGVCAICAHPETHMRNGKVKALAVDHSHETGEIRGLLCSDCNTGIGKLKDDRNVLLAAIKYLDKHAAEPNVTEIGGQA